MNNHVLTLILVLFVMLAGLSMLYVQKETFISVSTNTPTPTPTINLDISFIPNTDINNITTVIDNININGKYINVFQLSSYKAENGSVFNPLGQYMTITNNKFEDEWKNNSSIPFSLRILAKNGVSPLNYSLIWSSKYLDKPIEQDFSIWRPNAPPGYISLCDIIVMGFSEPINSSIICIPNSMLEQSPILKKELLDIQSISNDYNELENKDKDKDKNKKTNINPNFLLKCWNVSTHQFFKCNNIKKSDDENYTPILFQDEQNFKNNIYNIKQSNLNGLK